MRATARHLLGLGLLLALSGPLPAAEPPAMINYQGVLRDSSDTPLNGAWHTIFRFFSAETGGDEILIDEHPNASEKEVLVSNGLFSVALGSGNLFDGSGPGVYGSLSEVFRDYGTVWLEVEIDGEVLTPRVRVISAAYALNAGHLGGRAAAEFIDTSSASQTKSGELTADASAVTSSYGIRGLGQEAGGFFQDSDTTSQARLGYDSMGISATGSAMGGYFESSSGDGYVHLASGDLGLEVHGGGAVQDCVAEISHLHTASYVNLSCNHAAVNGRGPFSGGFFESDLGDSEAWVANQYTGVEAHGWTAGGEFYDTVDSGHAWIGYGHLGIDARGNTAGGYFADADNSGFAHVGYGHYGIEAHGMSAGGFFVEALGTGVAYVGDTNRGIWAYGDDAGGYFVDTNSSGQAYVAYGDYGIQGYGNEVGGYFEDANGSSVVWVGRNDNGISSYGTLMGGYFEDTDNGTVSRIAYGGYGIDSTGTKNFVQNHPYEDDKVVVYSSLEGDEVGTYTRGTARLVDGVAEITLGETFRWVTNPDVGLTAHLTAKGDGALLYVESLTTETMVVRAATGFPGDVAFDYVVFGLRIGFEEVAPVREKDEEAYIPSMDDHRERYERSPEMRRFNALERFKAMAAETRGVDAAGLDLSAAQALRTAVQEYDPEIHGLLGERVVATGAHREREAVDEASSHPAARLPAGGPPPSTTPAVLVADTTGPGSARDCGTESSEQVLAGGATLFPVSETVEAGDLLALDPDRPGLLRRAASMADPSVIGIAVGEALGGEGGLQAPLAGGNFTAVKADASYGAVLAGDLLTSSPTPGHAMVAIEAPPGTVIGKALEPLESGTGLIRVLVIPR